MKLEKNLYPPISVVEVDQGEEKYEIKSKMEGDNIGKIFCFTKYVPLCERKRKNHKGAPSAKT